MAAATPLYRALVRRKIQFFRWQRSRNNPTNQQQQKRSQSSHNHNNSNSNKPGHAREEDPVPVPSTVAALPLWQRLGPLTRAAQAYARSQRKRPYVTQVCTSLVIYLCADISAQRMNGKGYDPHRTVRSLIIGGLSSIPSYKWFVYLSHNFNYSSRILSLLVKIGINQACFTPLFNTYFFAMQALLVGDTLPEVWDRVRRTVPVSVVNSLKLWPAVTAFSFTFIPLEYRSVFAGTIAVGWQTYLAYLNRQAEEEEAREKMAHLSSHAQAQAQAHQAHQALPETISDKIPKKATA